MPPADSLSTAAARAGACKEPDIGGHLMLSMCKYVYLKSYLTSAGENIKIMS